MVSLSSVYVVLTVLSLGIPAPMALQILGDFTASGSLSVGWIFPYINDTLLKSLYADAVIATVTTELILLLVTFVVFMMYETHMRGMRAGRLYMLIAYYFSLATSFSLFCSRRINSETRIDGKRMPPRRFGFFSSFLYTILSVIGVVAMSTLSALKGRPHLFGLVTLLSFVILPWLYIFIHRSQPLKNSDHSSENRSKARTLCGVLCGASTVLAVVTRLRLLLFLTSNAASKVSYHALATRFLSTFTKTGTTLTIGMDAAMVMLIVVIMIASDDSLSLLRRVVLISVFLALPGLGLPLYIMMITGSSALRSVKLA